MDSPFALFRKNQKVLLALTAILAMIAFVFLGSCLQMIDGSSGPVRDPVVLTWQGGTIHESQMAYRMRLRGVINRAFLIARAEAELPVRQDTQLLRVSEQAVARSLILAKKAEEMQVIVTDQQVNQWLKNRLRVEPEAIERNSFLIDDRIPSSQIFEALRSALAEDTTLGLFGMSLGELTPEQRWDYFNRLERRIDMQILAVPVAEFGNEVPEPTESQLEDFFNQHKEQFADARSPIPGFRQPYKAEFKYFKIEFEEAIAEEIPKITEQQIAEYYEKNKEQFIVTEKLPDLTDPATPPGTPPATSAPDGAAPDAATPGSNAPGASTPGTTPPAEPATTPATPVAPAANPAAPGAPATNVPATEAPAAPAGSSKSEQPKTEQPKTDPAPAAPGTTPPAATAPPAAGDGKQSQMKQPLKRQPFSLVVYQDSEGKAEPATPAQPAATGTPAPAATTPAPATTVTTTTTPPATAPIAPGATAPPAAATDSAAPAGTAPAAAAPVDPTAPADPTVTTPPGATVPPTDPAAAPAAEKPVEYEPLDKVRKEIQRTLAIERIPMTVDSKFNKLRKAMLQYEAEYRRWNAKTGEDKGPAPQPLDMLALAQDNRVKSLQTKLMSLQDMVLAKTDLIRSRDSQTGLLWYQIAFRPGNLFQPGISNDQDGNHFLWWKVDEREEHIPKFADVREQVLDEWKIVKGRELAKKRAEELAATVTKAKQPMKDVFKDDKNLPVAEVYGISWLTSPNVPQMEQGAMPALSQVSGVEYAGEEFMKTAFGLQPSGVGVAFNDPQNVAYVIQVIRSEPTQLVLEKLFMMRPKDDLEIRAVASVAQQQTAIDWLNALEKEYGLTWNRQASNEAEE